MDRVPVSQRRAPSDRLGSRQGGEDESASVCVQDSWILLGGDRLCLHSTEVPE